MTRAGSNLPPSRGKGFVGVERAIFIVMTCGWPRYLRVARNLGGWVPACARTTGGGVGGRAVPEPPLREGNVVGWGSPPSPVFTRAGSNLPPSRGKGFVGVEWAIFLVMTCGWPRCLRVARRGGMGPRMGDNGGGWVCTPHARGGREGNRRGMGPRMREDNGRGRVPTREGRLLNLRCGLGRKAGLF